MARISTKGGLFFFFLREWGSVSAGGSRRAAHLRPPAPLTASLPRLPPTHRGTWCGGRAGRAGAGRRLPPTLSPAPPGGAPRRGWKLPHSPIDPPHHPPVPIELRTPGKKCGAALAPALRRAAGRRQSARALGGRRASVFVQRGLLLPRHRRSECEGRAAGREPRAGRAPRDAHAATAGRRCASERRSALLPGPAAVVAALGAAREGGRPGGRVGAWV